MILLHLKTEPPGEVTAPGPGSCVEGAVLLVGQGGLGVCTHVWVYASVCVRTCAPACVPKTTLVECARQPLTCQGGGRVAVVTAAGQGESTLVRVTGFSVCAVPPCVHALGGGEEGPRPIRQQRAPSHGRVSEPRARPPAQPGGGSPDAPVPLASPGTHYSVSLSAGVPALL